MPHLLSRRHAIAVTAAALFSARHVSAAEDDGTSVPEPYEVDGGALPPSPPSPTPEPTPTPEPAVPGEGAIFPANRVLSYYGFPGNPNMGILGEYSKEDLLTRLQEQGAEYETADNSRPWKLAFEVIASVAQADAGADGLYIMPTDPDVIQEYIDFTAANDLLLILDIQFGLDTIENELGRLRDYLRYSHVYPAIDPEFMLNTGEQPGVDLGSIKAEEVTYAQQKVAEWAAEDGVPEKFLLVHQFNYYMIVDKENIGIVDGVQLVINADGWGPP
ncbi:MAG: hypothetical protein ACRDHN_00175, partial [Thermomicrobiales bacterium]